MVGAAVLLLGARLLLNPLPLSNLLPAEIIALISLAYLEDDGIMLSLGLFAGGIIAVVKIWAFMETLHGANGLLSR